MAEIGIIEIFRAFHGSKPHEHDFKIEVVLEGEIDQQTEFVEGVDHYRVIAELKKIIFKLENQNLKVILAKEGYKFSTNESIAAYFMRLLKEKFPVKSVTIWETDNRYATVYSHEI